MKTIPTKTECEAIGTISRNYGNNGELVLQLFPRITINLSDVPYVFIEKDSMLVPFFFTIISRKKNKYIIHIEDVDTEKHSQEFVESLVFVESHNTDVVYGDKDFVDVRGFTVYDHDECLGIVNDVHHYFMHSVLQVVLHAGSHEVQIPFSQELISRLDEEKKDIYMSLPEGLLDM
ncbi:MAG: hypothetical protein R6U95_00590 [Bacteroidales bacterium]